MKTTTLNLQGFDTWNERQEPITAYLQSEQPDVVMFQEVVYLPEVSAYNQVHLLNQTLQYQSEYTDVTRLQVGLDYPVYREGLGFLSHYPVMASETLVLKQAKGDEHNRIVQLFDVLVGDTTIKFANVHFSLTDTVDYATAHLEELLETLTIRNEERIIAGDFNIRNIEASAHLWGERYHTSSLTPYISFPAENKCIDYILTPKQYTLESVSISTDGLSDHRAVTAEIAVR